MLALGGILMTDESLVFWGEKDTLLVVLLLDVAGVGTMYFLEFQCFD